MSDSPTNGVFTADECNTEGTNPSLIVDPDAQFPAGPAGYRAKYSASKIFAHCATLE